MPPDACRIAPSVTKDVGNPGNASLKSTYAVIFTSTVPDGVISVSIDPNGGGVRRRGVNTAVQTAASNASLAGSGQRPVTVASAYGHPDVAAKVRTDTSGGPCRMRPPGR